MGIVTLRRFGLTGGLQLWKPFESPCLLCCPPPPLGYSASGFERISGVVSPSSSIKLRDVGSILAQWVPVGGGAAALVRVFPISIGRTSGRELTVL